MIKVFLETLHCILKTYEVELLQKRAIQAGQQGNMTNTSSISMAQDHKILQLSKPQQQSQIKVEEILEEDEKVTLELKDVDEDKFYTLDELDNIKNKIMTYMPMKFSNLKFKIKNHLIQKVKF